MQLRSLTSRLGRLFKPNSAEPRPARTLPLDRDLTPEERAIAEWLLLHADPPAISFIPQLDVARVTGRCSCGCPTVNLRVPVNTPPAEPRDNPVGDAIGEVNGNAVGVIILQRSGYLTCLEVYDLSLTGHTFGLPDISSLKLF